MHLKRKPDTAARAPFGLLPAVLLLAALAAVPATAGNETPPEVARLLDEILASQEATETLQGRFTQEKTLALFKEPERSTGRFSYARPDRMRLDYDAPSAVVLLLAGDELLTYYPELKEAERFDVRKQKKRVFNHLIGEEGLGQLQKNFTIELIEDDRGDRAPGVASRMLHLVPRRRQLKRRIEFIDLWVRRSDNAPVQYYIAETTGDTTLFRLDEVEVNGDLPEGVFDLALPDDVTVTVRTGRDGSGRDDAQE